MNEPSRSFSTRRVSSSIRTLLTVCIALIAAICLSLLGGCNPQLVRPTPPVADTTRPASYSDEYYTRCPTIPKLTDKTEEAQLTWLTLVLDYYVVCAGRVDSHVTNMQVLFPRPAAPAPK